jgi:hypothetical protein
MSEEEYFDEWHGIDDEDDSTEIAPASPENVANGMHLFLRIDE